MTDLHERAYPFAIEPGVYSITNLASVQDEIRRVPLERVTDGSGSSHCGGPEQWIHGLSVARLLKSEMRMHYPLLADVVNRLHRKHNRRIVQIMVNKLEPFSGLKMHKDGPPAHRRFHLPLISSDRVEWWDEVCGTYTMREGYWYGPVNYCGWLHSMSNNGDTPRYHLIVDLEK